MHDTNTLREYEPITRRGALAFSASALASAVLLLAACGGGGSTTQAPAPEPAAEPVPAAQAPTSEPELPFMLDRHVATVDDVYGVAFGPAIESAAKAAKAASSSRYTVRATVIADNVNLYSFDDENRGTGLSFHSSSLPISGDVNYRNPRFFYDVVRNPDYFDRIRSEYPIFVSRGPDALNHVDTGAVAGRVIVDSDGAKTGFWDPNWMTLGYWWQLRGRDFMRAAARLPTLEGVEILAFADGPEFRRSPANLPVTGSATYRGSALGAYLAEYGTDSSDQTHIGQLREPGRRETFAGEFEAGMSLTMDYATGTVRGEIGVGTGPNAYGNITASGVFTSPSETTRVDDSLVPLIIDFTSEFNPYNGRFASNDVRVRGSGSTWRIVEQEGQWSGQVSSILTATGQPRSGIGTFGVDATTAGDTRHVFVGAFGVYYVD